MPPPRGHVEELDIGGLRAFGKVPIDHGAPLFEAAWERRVFGMLVALGRLGIDDRRTFAPALHPVIYLKAKYYERWLLLLEEILTRRKLITLEEIEGRIRMLAECAGLTHEPPTVGSYSTGASVGQTSKPQGRTGTGPDARFGIGDKVTATFKEPETGVRYPSFVRGHTGVVHRVSGPFVYPSPDSQGSFEVEHTYAVGFDPSAVWPRSAELEATSRPVVDIWESFLENATDRPSRRRDS